MKLIFFLQVSTYKESLYIGNIFLFFENYKSGNKEEQAKFLRHLPVQELGS